MTLTLFLLRHGETLYSQAGHYCGTTDAELTPAGVAMAAAIAKTLGDLSWAAVYASPMKRTLATVQPLCDRLGIAPRIRDGLREIDYGQWENQTREVVLEQYAEDYHRWMTEPAWNAPTGGETAVQIANRALGVIAEIEEQHRHGQVLIVSHKATIRIILCSLLGIDLGRYRDRLDCPAASLSVVEFTAYGPRLQRLGDRSHLPPELRDREGT